jgi:hypothetical protein
MGRKHWIVPARLCRRSCIGNRAPVLALKALPAFTRHNELPFVVYVKYPQVSTSFAGQNSLHPHGAQLRFVHLNLPQPSLWALDSLSCYGLCGTLISVARDGPDSVIYNSSPERHLISISHSVVANHHNTSRIVTNWPFLVATFISC